jgi:uncharacterized protein with NAD-binding domain and iron-sulfur cluster
MAERRERHERRRTVAVLGGGIAGLSAAHHLAAHGYQVTVFDQRGREADDLGGKARSYDDACDGERRYGEHGFRFFPGFYRHVVATMAEIPTGDHPPGEGNVAEHLAPLGEAAFYAHRPARTPAGARSGNVIARWLGGLLGPLATTATGLAVRLSPVAVLAWVLAACVLWDAGSGATSWWVWAALPAAAVAGQAMLVGLLSDADRHLVVPLPGDDRSSRRGVPALVLRHHRGARWLLVPGLLAVGGAIGPPGSWPAVVVVAAVVWFLPALAAVSELWGLVGRIPLSVRPGLLESAWAFFRVGTLITSCRRRLHEQWEHESWWSYIGAYRFSRGFRLAFATGLTRSFVATRAEAMSSRTGATILAQLLYDVSWALGSRERAADRVLDGPTHETWIRPWIAHLERHGVRFNQFVEVDGDGEDGDDVEVRVTRHRSVDVTRIRAVDAGTPAGGSGTGLRVDGFDFLDPTQVAISPTPACQAFDHYVLAIAGSAAQRVVANSPDLVALDRGVDPHARPGDPLGDLHAGGRIPLLHRCLDLRFGWMSGIVYHLQDRVELPRGHLLCLESEWALTVIEQSQVWTERGRDTSPWKAVVSVNISDWESPSSHALPAHLEDLDAVAAETWRQIQQHVPALDGVEAGRDFVSDTAINDPTALAIAKGTPLPEGAARTGPVKYENLALTNDEKLLVNTTGSWDDRPTARTVFDNLVLAGDYVRTTTDFASMEAADEAARRAVNVILERDGSDARCDVAPDLEVPSELRRPTLLVRAVDRVALWLHLPHPLSMLATPFGWLAGAEMGVRRLGQRIRRI